ncbi:MAG: hypothetical protein CMN78_02450 [Spirochaetales bacterium]|nr:hypothetical protein [Spirochaetales bacterium]
MTNIALIGLGFMGRAHLATYKSVPGANIVAVCDRYVDFGKSNVAKGNLSVGDALPDLTGINTYADVDKMLGTGGFDAVDICLPTYLHAEVAIKSLRAGYHVMCEKPMALSKADGLRMTEVARERSKVLSVGQCLRFWPAYAEVKKFVAENTFGRLRHACLERYSTMPTWSQDNWMADPEKSGLALIDLHIHDLDFILYLLGRPESVQAHGVAGDQGGIRQVNALFKYPDAIVMASGGWLATESFGFRMRAFFTFEQATVDLDFSREPNLTVYPAGAEPYTPDLAEGDGYQYELMDFLECIKKGTFSDIVPPESAAESVGLCRIVEKIIRENT